MAYLAVRACPELEWNICAVEAFWSVARPFPLLQIFDVHYVDGLVKGYNAVFQQAYFLIWDGFNRWFCFLRRVRRRRRGFARLEPRA